MQLTIIPVDGCVMVDGKGSVGLDFSSASIPANVHALQWFDNRGWIEFNQGNDPFAVKPANQDIYSLPDWATNCIEILNNKSASPVEENVTPTE